MDDGKTFLRLLEVTYFGIQKFLKKNQLKSYK